MVFYFFLFTLKDFFFFFLTKNLPRILYETLDGCWSQTEVAKILPLPLTSHVTLDRFSVVPRLIPSIIKWDCYKVYRRLPS